MYRRFDKAGAIEWVDAATCAPEQLGRGLIRQAALSRLHLRTHDGQLLSGAQAFIELWKALPRWQVLGHVMDHRWALSVLELGYRVFLSFRRAWRKT